MAFQSSSRARSRGAMVTNFASSGKICYQIIKNGPVIMSFNINLDSVKDICVNANQVMIYGWRSCGYEEVIARLKKNDSPIRKVFDWCPDVNEKTLEGKSFEKIRMKNGSLETICKTRITMLVLENYKRKQKDQPIIPLIFLYDIEDNPFQTTPSTITSRSTSFNELLTNIELRRCYKMCCEKNPGLKLITEVARETIRFIKLTRNSKDEYTFVLLKPFWEEEEWDSRWNERQATKEIKSTRKMYLWREQLKSAIANNPSEKIIFF